MPEFKKVVRHRLKVLMAEADITPAALAEKSGVSLVAIRKYLNAETVPLFESAVKLAHALGCTPNDLCGFTDKDNK